MCVRQNHSDGKAEADHTPKQGFLGEARDRPAVASGACSRAISADPAACCGLALEALGT